MAQKQKIRQVQTMGTHSMASGGSVVHLYHHTLWMCNNYSMYSTTKKVQ